jgi:hypothetical protein
MLFYNEEYLNIFNKFIIYILIIDLLLSTFYYFSIQDSFKPRDTCIDPVKYDLRPIEDFVENEELESEDESLVLESDDDTDESLGISEDELPEEHEEHEAQEEQEQEEVQQEKEVHEEVEVEVETEAKLDEIFEVESTPFVIEPVVEVVEKLKQKRNRAPKKKVENIQLD